MIRPQSAAFIVSLLAGFAWVAAGAWRAAPASPAAEPPRTISVSGVGEVPVQVERMTLRARLLETSEVAEDAREELAGARAKALEELLSGDVPNLVVRTLGPQVGYAREPEVQNRGNNFVIINGQVVSQDEAPGAGTRFTEEVALDVYGLESFDSELLEHTAARLVDAVLGAGLDPTAGEGELIELGLVDSERVERAAYEAALSDARRRAALVAELAGLTLGAVRAVEIGALDVSWRRLSHENPCRVELGVVFDVE